MKSVYKNSALFFMSFAVVLLLSNDRAFGQKKQFEKLLGTWDVETESAGYTFIFTFSMAGDSLKGVYSGSSGDVPMKEIGIEDNTLIFAVDAGGMEIDFSVTFDENNMSGQLEMSYGSAEITGTKRKKKKLP